MADCPRCRAPLVRTTSQEGIAFGCARCGGREVAFPVLRRIGATADFLRQVWLACRQPGVRRSLPCPHCNRKMAAVEVRSGDHVLSVDVCTFCEAIWFDRHELEAVPKRLLPPPELSPAAREQLALFKLQSDRELHSDDSTGQNPPEWWQWAPWILGLPVQIDGPELKSRPWATWAVAAACVAITAIAWNLMGDKAAAAWGFIPADWAQSAGLTVVTSFFLHGDILHLIINMYFLLVFAEHVEDNLGPLRFLLLLGASHVAGVALHGALAPDSAVPVIGASAGISGMLAYYAVMFPRARIGVLVRFLFRLTLPAIAMFILYMAVQMAGAVMQMYGDGDVSHLGHLGGMAAGLASGITARALKRAPPEFA